jgi:hypothetical protein
VLLNNAKATLGNTAWIIKPDLVGRLFLLPHTANGKDGLVWTASQVASPENWIATGKALPDYLRGKHLFSKHMSKSRIGGAGASSEIKSKVQ